MRYFFSSGEASGELAAVAIAQAIRRADPHARFEGIGAARMREAGFTLWRDHTGWATFGPFSVIPRLPKVVLAGLLTAWHIARTKPDAVVLVDYGAFNVRLSKIARFLRYAGPIIDVFPPGAWLDSEKTARDVARVATPVTAFEHQRDFYRSLDLPIAYFGHPLVSQYAARDANAAAARDSGIVALLPGSRPAELRYHVPLLLGAFRELKARRPALRGVFGAADDRIAHELQRAAARDGAAGLQVVRGVRAAVEQANAAWVASGTAVLECALLGVPQVALYVVSPALARWARKAHTLRYVTLPNIVLQREIVPEFLQEAATPGALARVMDDLLQNPQRQSSHLHELRQALGPPDALERCAAFIVERATQAIA